MNLRIRKLSCVGFTRAHIFSSLKMVTTCSSETSVLTRSTHRHNPEDGIPNKSILQVRLHGAMSQKAELFKGGSIGAHLYLRFCCLSSLTRGRHALSPSSLYNIVRCRGPLFAGTEVLLSTPRNVQLHVCKTHPSFVGMRTAWSRVNWFHFQLLSSRTYLTEECYIFRSSTIHIINFFVKIIVDRNFSFLLPCPRNTPWRPIGLSDMEDPTLSRQSAHS
jgi:hypothetical protein